MRFFWMPAGGLILAMSSASYAEAPFDLAKLSPAAYAPLKVSAADPQVIIVSAVRREQPKLEVSRDHQKKSKSHQVRSRLLSAECD